MTIQQTIIDYCNARPKRFRHRTLYLSRRYVSYDVLGADGKVLGHLYLGKNGAVRYGKSIATSHPAEDFKARVLARANNQMSDEEI